MTHGLVEPLQKEHERIVRLSLRLRSNLSGQCQGSQGDQSPADCRFSVDHGLVGERGEIHDSLPSIRFPASDGAGLLLARGKEARRLRGQKGGFLRGDVARLTPLSMRLYRVRIRCVKGSGDDGGSSPGPAFRNVPRAAAGNEDNPKVASLHSSHPSPTLSSAMARNPGSRTAVAAIVAGVLIFAGQAGELALGDAPTALWVALLVAGIAALVPVSAEENTRLVQSAYEAFGRGRHGGVCRGDG